MAHRARPGGNAAMGALLAVRIADEVSRQAGAGMEAARTFLTARVKEILSTPAPRIAVRSAPGPGQRRGGILRYRAATRAVPGAPPRKLSGRLRSSVWSSMRGPQRFVVGANARSERGFNYPAHHELRGLGPTSGRHPFISVAVDRHRADLTRIIGAAIKLIRPPKGR